MERLGERAHQAGKARYSLSSSTCFTDSHTGWYVHQVLDYYLRCPLTPFNGTQSLPIFRKKVLSTEGASGGSAEIAYPSYPRWSTVAIERKVEFDCLEKVFFLVDGF